MIQVVLRPKARRDLQEILAHYRREAGLEVARRFRAAAARTFADLAQQPGIGVIRRVRSAEFRGVRMWRIRDFTDYLVFYFEDKNGIRVERVIHAARDYRRVLGRG